MKVLYLTKYSRNGASSRLRSYQYFPFLEKNGINVTVRPFFDENYLINLYSGKQTSKWKHLKFYLNRFFILFTIYKYQRIVIEKELFPYFFSWFEKILQLLKVKYIVDYDDAIFHNYDLSENKIVSFLLKNKINNVMRYSGCVVAGNDYLTQRAKFSGAKKVIKLPTVIDIDSYSVRKKSKSSKIVIGWIGSPSTFKYISKSKSIFLELLRKFDVELHIVGVTEGLCMGPNVKYLNWTEDTEVDLISNFDIGIMPLDDSPWELGKCSYKLIQYMGCGVAAVASPIGMNKDVVIEGEDGFFASTPEEWIAKLSLLIEDANLRNFLGNNGRRKIESNYCLQNSISTVISIIRNG